MELIYNVDILNCEDYDMDKVRSIEQSLTDGVNVTSEDIQYFLDYTCFEARRLLTITSGEKQENFNFRNKCDRAQAMIGYYFDQLGLDYHAISTLKCISDKSIRHFSLAAQLGEEYYLIDPTYNQFFDRKNCEFADYKIVSNVVKATPNPGYFVSKMPADYQNKMVSFLERGYGVLDEDLAFAYGNSFYKTRVGLPLDVYLSSEIGGNIYLKSFLHEGKDMIKTYEQLADEGLVLPVLSENNTKKM